MHRKLLGLALVVALAMSAGCVMPKYGAIYAPVQDLKSTVEVGDTSVGMSKVGVATAEGIILLARGDASLTAAMKDGKISKIHHVDSEELNILSVYCKQTIKVYGE
jgi:hypothetical protein